MKTFVLPRVLTGGLAAAALVFASGFCPAARAQGPGDWRIQDHGQARTFSLSSEELYVEEPGGGTGGLKRRAEGQLPGALMQEDGVGRGLLKLPVDLARKSAAEQRDAVRRLLPGARLAPVFYLKGAAPGPRTRRIASSQVLVEVPAGQTADEIAATAGAKARKTNVEGRVLLEFGDADQALAGLVQLQARGLRAEPQLRHQSERRSEPNDPFYDQQWHLHNIGQGNGTAGIDANVEHAWDITKGAGVNIAIIDDCLQISHPDLSANAYPLASNFHYDFNDVDNNPSPGLYDAHGTSVGGVAAARGNNSQGVSGSAPEASLVGLRLISGPASDSDEATALFWQPASLTIGTSNNSWGPYDGGGLAGPDILARNALMQAATTGRGGLGLVTVFAAGNGLQYADNANLDGYANSRYVLAVSAVTNQGQQAYYSEPGANILVAAPSNGGTLGIFTTDVISTGGYNPGAGEPANLDYTNSFGGTSSAAPLVTGGVALMLAANPALGWRDVHEILASTAVRVRPTDSDWKVNGGGFKFNHKFGGGMVDLTAAVVRALDWQNLGAEVGRGQVISSGLPVTIPDNNTTGITRTFDFTGGQNLRVERVEVELAIRHAHRSDLEITLTSPAGMVSTLIPNRARPNYFATGDDDTDYMNGDSGWVFTSTHHWGENSAGTWSVRIRDRRSDTVGSLTAAAVRLFGTVALQQRVTFSSQTSSVAETAGNAALTVSRLGGTTGTVTVDYVISPKSTATAGQDYTDVSGTLTFGPGVASAVINVPILDDALSEGPEYIYVLLKNPSGAAMGGTSMASLRINDNEANLISVVASDPVAGEKLTGQAADTGEFTIQRTFATSQAVTVNYSVTGTATSNVDYTALSGTAIIPAFATEVKVPVTALDDSRSEGGETVVLTLVENPLYTIGSPDNATVVIRDNDLPAAQISVSTGSVLETVTDPVTFTVSLSSPSDNPITVNLATSGMARPAVNFNPPVPAKVEIPAGASSATFQVYPVNNTLSQGTLTLAVEVLSAVGDGVTTAVDYKLGFNTISRLAFLDNEPAPDTNDPKVTITSPAEGARIDVGQPVVASGTASDNGGVKRVIYRVNSGPWQVATGTKSWTADLTLAGLQPGPNLLRVRSEDKFGNQSPVLSRNFNYVALHTLNVTVTGSGSVSSGYAPSSQREAGVSYKITATPAAGFAFDGWSGDLASSSSSFHFVMPDSDTSLVAKFVPTPFQSTPPISGTYTGLVEGTPFSADTSGQLKLTLTTAGAFSATLSLGSKDYPLAGEFTASGIYQGKLTGPGGAELIVDLQLDVTPGATDRIVGTVSSSIFPAPATITADRKVYDATTNPYPTGGAAKLVYHVLLPAGSTSAPEQPHGSGFGVLIVKPNGMVKWSGRLADGVSVSGSAPLSKAGVFPLYTRPYDGRGVFLGEVTVNEALPDHDVTGQVNWLKPARRHDINFPLGFTVEAGQLYGSRYTAPAAGTRALAGFADATSNGSVTLSDGKLAAPIVKTVTYDANNSVKVENASKDRLSFTIDPLLGRFSGSFFHPVSREFVPIQGILLQRENQAVGQFRGTSLGGANPQTGPVLLQKVP